MAASALLIAGNGLHPDMVSCASSSGQIPGFPVRGDDIRVVVVAGAADQLGSPSWLVVERHLLLEGDTLPRLATACILFNESGTLSVIDDLGLEASLPEQRGIYLPPSAADHITATSPASVLRVVLRTEAPIEDVLFAGQFPPNTFDFADLWFAFAILPRGRSLGAGTTLGPVALVAPDTDLTVVRPRRLPAVLPSTEGIMIPVDTEMEIRNDSGKPATVVLAGLAPAGTMPMSVSWTPTPIANPTNTPIPSPTSTKFPPTPTRTPTRARTTSTSIPPTATANPPTQTRFPSTATPFRPRSSADARDYLPPVGDIYGTGGFTGSQVINLASSGDSLFQGISSETLRHWKEGVLCLYYPTSRLTPTKIDQILVSVDRFDASSKAADAFTLLTEGLEKPSQRETRPWNDYAWATWASWVEFDEPVGRLLMFAGHFDLVVVLFAMTIGDGGDPEPAYDLFRAIDPTR